MTRQTVYCVDICHDVNLQVLQDRGLQLLRKQGIQVLLGEYAVEVTKDEVRRPTPIPGPMQEIRY